MAHLCGCVTTALGKAPSVVLVCCVLFLLTNAVMCLLEQTRVSFSLELELQSEFILGGTGVVFCVDHELHSNESACLW